MPADTAPAVLSVWHIAKGVALGLLLFAAACALAWGVALWFEAATSTDRRAVEAVVEPYVLPEVEGAYVAPLD